jgi:hypothetical protein
MLSKQDVSNLSDGPHLWRFATQLSEQGYAHKTTVRYIAVAADCLPCRPVCQSRPTANAAPPSKPLQKRTNLRLPMLSAQTLVSEVPSGNSRRIWLPFWGDPAKGGPKLARIPLDPVCGVRRHRFCRLLSIERWRSHVERSCSPDRWQISNNLAPSGRRSHTERSILGAFTAHPIII